MVLIVLSTVLVLGIAFFQAVQGTYSALVMAILTTVSVAVTFGYYEPVAAWLQLTQPGYADATAILALFVLSLLALRVAADMFLNGNVILGMWPDRIAGGALGLYTGMVLVGVLLIVLQLLPWGGTVIGFRPFDNALRRSQAAAPFYPDEFVLGLARTLGAGGLGGDRRLGEDRGDLLQAAFCERNTAGKAGRRDCLPDSLMSATWSEPEASFWATPVPAYPLLDKSARTRVVIVEARIRENAREYAEGAVSWWFLPATHFRLVTNKRRPYYPVAFLTPVDPSAVVPAKVEDEVAQIGTLVNQQLHSSEKYKEARVQWVYRMPVDEEPYALVFRRVSEAKLTKAPFALMPRIAYPSR